MRAMRLRTRDAKECLVHLHAHRVPIVAKADHDHAVLFGQDRLVDLPPVRKVGQKVRHGVRRPDDGAEGVSGRGGVLSAAASLTTGSGV